VPNRIGGKENIDAIHFEAVNERVYESFPQAMMIAEESTACHKYRGLPISEVSDLDSSGTWLDA